MGTSEHPARELLPEVKVPTEENIARLIADTNPDSPLTRVNAIRALQGPQGAIVKVAGSSGQGADVIFQAGSRLLCREVKSIVGGAQGSFNREVAHAATQIAYRGEILVQMPQGTDALRFISRFRGSRPDPTQLEKYCAVRITIVDPLGTVLFEGSLASEEETA
jgi:hypothetical protein